MGTLHPKTSGAALGGAAGVVIVAILHSISGIHLAPGIDASIPTFLSTLGAYLVPSAPTPPPTPPPATVARVEEVPVTSVERRRD